MLVPPSIEPPPSWFVGDGASRTSAYRLSTQASIPVLLEAARRHGEAKHPSSHWTLQAEGFDAASFPRVFYVQVWVRKDGTRDSVYFDLSSVFAGARHSGDIGVATDLADPTEPASNAAPTRPGMTMPGTAQDAIASINSENNTVRRVLMGFTFLTFGSAVGTILAKVVRSARASRDRARKPSARSGAAKR